MSLDPTLAKFENLKVLNLSFNCITKIEFLPPNLEELYLNGNEINEVALNPARPLNKMIHLGLSMNKIRSTALSLIVKVFPNLFCLDISFNDLCDLDSAIVWCKQLKSLKMLFMEGNPLVFTNNYTEIVQERVHGIKVLDGNPVFLDQAVIDIQQKNITNKLKESKKSLAGSLSSAASTVQEEFLCELRPNLSLDIQFRLLKNIKGGRYLIPDENCQIETEKLDEIPDELKSSQYWMSYNDHHGKEIHSEKKTYIKHFQVEEQPDGTTSAKTDMDFKLRIEERPSIELRDWMYNDIVVTFWESRPKFQKVRDEASEQEVERVVLDDKKMPVTETNPKGVLKINLMDWLKKSPADPSYSSSQKKQKKNASSATGAADSDPNVRHEHFRFYSQDLLTTPEFRYENKLDVIKPKDKAFILEYLELKEKHEAELKAAADAAAAEASATPAKGKADPKKDAKKPPAKGAAPVEDKNSPQSIVVEYPADVKSQEEFMIFERKYNAKEAPVGKKGGPPPTAPVGKNTKKDNPWGDLGDKLKDRQKELIEKYKIIRGSPFTLAIEIKLNKEVPTEPLKEETLSEQPPPVDDKKKKK